MASSGSFAVSTSNTYVKGSVEWTVTSQNITGNTSTVQAKLILERTNTGYTTSGSDTFYITIDGTEYSSGNTSFSLTYNSNTVIMTATKTVTHSADGTKTCGISWRAANGSYNPFNLTSGSGSAVLNTIPRASSVTSAITWTAGTQNLAISVDRATNAFTHIAEIYVQDPDLNWDYIGETPAEFGASTTMVFNSTHITRMYQALDGYENRPAKIVLKTYSGATLIGSTTKALTTDKCNGIPIAKISFSGATFNIGSSITATVSPVYDGFSYTGTMTLGSFTKALTFSDTSTSATISFTQTEIDSMYTQTSTVTSKAGTITVYSKYNGVDVNDYNPKPAYDNVYPFTAKVVNSNPTFAGGLVYYDYNNPATTTITNNTAYIIQKKSKVKVEIPSNALASPKNKATIIDYTATLNGVPITKPHPVTAATVVFDFAEVDAKDNLTLTVTARDSRQLTTPQTKTINMVEYAAPVIAASAKRVDGFGEPSLVNMSGNISLISVLGTPKNVIQLLQYRIKKTTEAVWNDTLHPWTTLSYTLTGSTYTANTVNLNLSSFDAFNVEFKIQDKIQTVTYPAIVSVGQPILFMDSVKKSVGIGTFPTISNGLEIATGGNGLTIGGSKFRSGGTGNNSTVISGTNGIIYLRPTGDVDPAKEVQIDSTGTGSATFTGEKTILDTKSTVNAGLEIGSTTNASTPYIDFHCGATLVDYDVRMLISNGTGVVGAGLLNIKAGTFQFNGLDGNTIAATGSSSNGKYIRYTDGTQVCWVRFTVTDQAINSAYGSLWQGVRTWTYPASFIGPPIVNCTEFQWGSGASWGTVGDLPTTTNVVLRGIDVSTRATGTTTTIGAFAVGSWK